MAKIAISRPCCDWRRSCRAQGVSVYDIDTKAIINEVYPMRCWAVRMEGKDPHEEVVLEFDELKHMVFYHYRTNSNRGRVIFYNIPPTLSFDRAVELVRRIFDFDEISVAEMAEPTVGNEYLYSMYYYKPL
jgi:hypothetical protein